MSDSTLSKDLADLVNRINSMPDGARNAILKAFSLLRPSVRSASSRSCIHRCKLPPLTLRNLVLLKQVHAMCERRGYTLPSNTCVSLRDLDAALKASNTDLDERFRIKAALAQLNLL